ncbi:MAG TPA: hypothetical protein VGH36_05870 [Acetobacteraceae bacterium]|jgi:hypothetical protein
MAQTTLDAPPALSPDAFTADRMQMWAGFCHFVTIAAGAVALVVILLALFLL